MKNAFPVKMAVFASAVFPVGMKMKFGIDFGRWAISGLSSLSNRIRNSVSKIEVAKHRHNN